MELKESRGPEFIQCPGMQASLLRRLRRILRCRCRLPYQGPPLYNSAAPLDQRLSGPSLLVTSTSHQPTPFLQGPSYQDPSRTLMNGRVLNSQGSRIHLMCLRSQHHARRRWKVDLVSPPNRRAGNSLKKYERRALLERLVSVLQEDTVDFRGEPIPNPKTDTPVECFAAVGSSLGVPCRFSSHGSHGNSGRDLGGVPSSRVGLPHGW